MISFVIAFFLYGNLSAQRTGSPNPAARYCKLLGYDYKIIKGNTGEKGVCILPNGFAVDAWDFYKGKVGQEYSYCARNGYSIELKTINYGNFIEECPICIQKDKDIQIPMDVLMRENGIFLFTDPKVSLDTSLSNIQFKQSHLNGTSLIESLPTSFDWRNRDGHAYIGDIRDQGDCGSCYAFAAVAAAECTFNWKNHFRDNCRFELSESFIMWCLGSIAQWGDNFYGCNGADYSYTELTALCDSGICYRSDYPYTIVEPDNCTHWNDPRVFFSDWNRVSCNDYNSIKSAIYTYGAVDAAVILSTSFMQYSNGIYSDSYSSCSSSPCYNTPTNHSVALIGWGNDETYGDYWILRNSWGEDWGEDGYMRIAVNSARIACEVTYIEANEISLTGANLVCSSPNQTYVLNDRPSGTSVSWTKSTNLNEFSHTSDSFTVYSTGNGVGWVQANITNNGCNDPAPIIKNIAWIGTPDPTITGEQYPGCGDINWYFLDPDDMWGTYSWSVTYNLSVLGSSLGHKAQIRANQEGTSTIYCDVTNTCGTNHGSLQVFVGECFDFLIIPNPTHDYINIQIDETTTDINELDSYEITIINLQNIVVLQQRTSNPITKLSVKDLFPGIYFVQIVFKGKFYTKQFIIN